MLNQERILARDRLMQAMTRMNLKLELTAKKPSGKTLRMLFSKNFGEVVVGHFDRPWHN